MSQTLKSIEYTPPGPVAAAYIRDLTSRVKLIVGPVGSGKTVASLIFLWLIAGLQEPGSDGIRRTRFIICRASYPKLISTTIKTFFEWVGKEYGKYTQDSPICFRIQAGDIDAEFYFLALEKDEDVEKLKSLEATYIYFGEISEITTKSLFDQATVRVGRFPGKQLCPNGATHYGVIADSNACSKDHFVYRLFVEERPPGYSLYHQPSGLSADAENVSALPNGYYENACLGKDPAWVDVFVHAQWGQTLDGKAVYQGYRDRFHCAEQNIEPDPNLGLFIGGDVGVLVSAFVIAQKTIEGRLIVLDEFITENLSVQDSSERLSSYLATNYPEFQVAGAFLDPAGGSRSLSDGGRAIEILAANTGWRWLPAPGDNNIFERIEAVRSLLNRVSGAQPLLFISPKAKILRAGFMGEYHFKTVKKANDKDIFHDTPNKLNRPYADVHDSLQYLVLGTGGMDAVLNKGRKGDRPSNWGEPIPGYHYGRPDLNARQGVGKAAGVNGDVDFDGSAPSTSRVRKVRSPDPKF